MSDVLSAILSKFTMFNLSKIRQFS